jgi:acyl-CoA synthetase (AMP-forming)/AMP-acid ligase II
VPDPYLRTLFEQLLAAGPDLPALVQDGKATSFAQWWADSGRIAGTLAERGVRKGDMVALMLPSGQDFASCYLAALRLGAIASGVNPRLGPTEIEHILARSEPTAIVTDEPGRVATAAATVLTPGQARGEGAEFTGWVDERGDEPAAVVWTTGTTGLPKGAWFDHETMAFIGANLGPLSALHDRKLMPIPFAHTGYLTRIYDQLIHRSAYVLTPPVWTADSMLDVLASEKITLGQGVPTQWEKLIQLDRLDEADLSSLRIVSTGAARVPEALVKALHHRLKVPVVIRYASTEVPLAFGTRIGDPIEVVATTVGQPLGGAEVEIRDPLGKPVPPGETGRIHLKTKARMRGYWRDPEQSARAITPDGWLVSSDLGHLDSGGNLAIVGRADDAYIRGGYNIYPSEVEAVLATHPTVARVTVVGTAAPVIGEIGVAFVVRSASAETDEAELKSWCRERIADYKVPDIIAFVDDLPVNATFKVDTGQLKTIAVRLAAVLARTSARAPERKQQ